MKKNTNTSIWWINFVKNNLKYEKELKNGYNGDKDARRKIIKKGWSDKAEHIKIIQFFPFSDFLFCLKDWRVRKTGRIPENILVKSKWNRDKDKKTEKEENKCKTNLYC